MRIFLSFLFLIMLQSNTFAIHDRVVASWYGDDFHGNVTANGEIFNKYALTAAHNTLPFGTLIEVQRQGKKVVVRINDRGPFVAGRSIDLSEAAAKEIKCKKVGVCKVRLVVLE